MKQLMSFLLLIGIFVSSAIAQPVPANMEQRIRQIYAAKYPDDFSMQKTLIEDQLDSYRLMQRNLSEQGIPRT